MLFIVLFSCCMSESERTLREKIDDEEFDFENLREGSGNMSYELKGNIQYGLIEMKNGDFVKFWFLSHHCTSDKGGTFYEYPNGNREFYSGQHCCEVQFIENGLDKEFSDIEEFRSFVKERNRVTP
jgi:hypothetical protein